MKIEHYTVNKHAIREIPLGVPARDLASKLYWLSNNYAGVRLTGLVKNCETKTFDLEFEEERK